MPAWKSGKRADRVRDLVGAHVQGVTIADFQSCLHSRLKQKRFKTEVLAETVSKRMYGIGHHGTNPSHIDRLRIDSVFTKRGAKERSKFIGRGFDARSPPESGL